MLIYYLKNRIPHEDKYYTASDSKGMETDATTNTFARSAFFLSRERAEAEVPEANNWWSPHDFAVESIEFDELKKKLHTKKVSIYL